MATTPIDTKTKFETYAADSNSKTIHHPGSGITETITTIENWQITKTQFPNNPSISYCYQCLFNQPSPVEEILLRDNILTLHITGMRHRTEAQKAISRFPKHFEILENLCDNFDGLTRAGHHFQGTEDGFSPFSYPYIEVYFSYHREERCKKLFDYLKNTLQLPQTILDDIKKQSAFKQLTAKENSFHNVLLSELPKVLNPELGRTLNMDMSFLGYKNLIKAIQEEVILSKQNLKNCSYRCYGADKQNVHCDALYTLAEACIAIKQFKYAKMSLSSIPNTNVYYKKAQYLLATLLANELKIALEAISFKHDKLIVMQIIEHLCQSTLKGRKFVLELLKKYADGLDISNLIDAEQLSDPKEVKRVLALANILYTKQAKIDELSSKVAELSLKDKTSDEGIKTVSELTLKDKKDVLVFSAKTAETPIISTLSTTASTSSAGSAMTATTMSASSAPTLTSSTAASSSVSKKIEF